MKMIKKSIIISIALVFVVGGFLAGNALAADKGPAEMTLKTAAGKKPAHFPHAKHQEKLGCGDCHHGAADGKQVAYVDGQEIHKCEHCHNGEMANPKLKNFKGAAHANCKGCHQKHKDVAPTKCNGCHPKKH